MKKSKEFLKQLKKLWKKTKKFVQKKTTLYVLFGVSFLLILSTLIILNSSLVPNSDIREAREDEIGIFSNSNPTFDVHFGKKEDESAQWIRFESETKESNSFDPNYQVKKKDLLEKVSNIFKKKEKLGIEMSLSGVKLSETGSETIEEKSDGELKVSDILGTEDIETSTELLEIGRILGKNDSEQSISVETILNKNVWKGIDLEYQILEGIGVKEEIIVRSLESYMGSCSDSETDCEVPLNEYIFDLQLDEGVELHQSLMGIKDNPIGTYYFTDSDNNYLAHFLPSFAFDNGGARTTGVDLTVKETEEEGSYKVHVILDLDWLLSSERVFPIHIDPSIVHDDSADFDAGSLNRLEDATGPKIQLVEQELSADEHTVGLWHMDETTESIATGGTITYDGDYTVHAFTSSGTFSLNSAVEAQILIVAGGGGGGSSIVQFGSGGGGGGGGGIVYYASQSITVGDKAITVGAGGAGNGNGGNSSFTGLTTALGGGAGGIGTTTTDHGSAGGRGGGGGWPNGVGASGSQGGNGAAHYSTYAGGGGGGDGNASTYNGASGSNYSAIFGTTYGESGYFSGGGAGGCWTDLARGVGGSGGGGDGARIFTNNASAGGANTGGGGGGAYGAYTQANGGSGIVIIRYLAGPPTVEDFSGSGNDGIATGATSVDGIIDNARSFNGSSDYISIPNSSSLDISSTDEVTLEAWIYPTGDPTDSRGTIVTKSMSYYMQHYIDDRITVYTYHDGGGSSYFYSNSTIQRNTWNHVAFTENSSGYRRIYINGILDVGGQYEASIDSSSNNVSVGNEGSTRYFEGKIDEVRISNIARSPEEIKANAQKRPYGVYVSDTIDLTAEITSIDDLQWTETGVSTGDGETPYSTTGLVGQWDFNETSGTVADNEGSCGASCDGTLTNMTTTGQDDGIGTGWTAINKKWGEGAVMFDGGNDHVQIPFDSSINITTLTLSAWIKPNTIDYGYVITRGDSTNNTEADKQYEFGLRADGTMRFRSNGVVISEGGSLEAGKWQFVAVTYDSSETPDSRLYVDGVEVATGNGTVNTDANAGVTIGSNVAVNNFFKGSIDTPKIYSRALSASEILSNYNSTNIEFLTRTSADGSTWEEWKPSTGETQIESMDDYSVSGCTGGTAIDGGRAYMFTSSGTFTCTSGGDVEVLVVAGGGGGGFDMGGGGGGGGVIHDKSYTVTNSTPITVTVGAGGSGAPAAGTGGQPTAHQYTIPATNGQNSVFGTLTAIGGGFGGSSPNTFTPGSTGGNGGSGGGASGYNNNGGTIYGGTGISGQGYAGGNQGSAYYSGGGGGAGSVGVSGNSRANGGIGYFSDILGPGYYWGGGGGGAGYSIGGGDGGVGGGGGGSAGTTTGGSGLNNGLPGGGGCTVCHTNTPGGDGGTNTGGGGGGGGHYNSNNKGGDGGSGVVMIKLSSFSKDSNTKIEGTGSQKIATGHLKVDNNTVGLWHLDETGGTGAYIKDSGGSNDGTPTGTTIINGVSAKARSFNGSEKIVVGDIPSSGSQYTLEAWVKPSTYSFIGSWGAVIVKESSYGMWISNTGFLRCHAGNGSSWSAQADTTNTASIGSWTHIACVYNGSTLLPYINGIQQGNLGYSGAPGDNSNIVEVGYRTPSAQGFIGSIDGVRVSNIARTLEEIYESYRMGRDHRISTTISSTDISSSTKVPFWMAADRPGTYLEALVGESSYVDNIADSNTVGLWHLEEETGSGAYIKDLSGNRNNGTPTGTTFVQGKIGKARSFNGSSNKIIVPRTATLEPTTFTLSAWVKPNSTQTTNYTRIIDKAHTDAQSKATYEMMMGTTSTPMTWFATIRTTTGGYQAASSNIDTNANQWNHIVVTFDGSKLKGYTNGMLSIDYSITGATPQYDSGDLSIGNSINYASNYFSGSLDEVRISNIARTSTEIRQSYELGLRTHPITIDFGASLDSGNLITGDTDKTFTIDATTVGLSEKGSNLYYNDKVIVKENYNGTEYIAQGDVISINESTGAVEVDAWDTASTFPSGGYTVNATVFKWQREYMDVSNIRDDDIDALTNISFRVTNGNEGRNIWIDDIKHSGYLSDPSDTANVTSTVNRYMQYMAVVSTNDTNVTPYFSDVTINYTANTGPSNDQIMRHGKWFNSSGEKQKFWWTE